MPDNSSLAIYVSKGSIVELNIALIYGVGTAAAVRIYTTYGDDAI